MTASVWTPEQATRSGIRRAARTGYRWLLLVFLLAVAVQIFLAGLGVFSLGAGDRAGSDHAFSAHQGLGFAIAGASALLLVLAIAARLGRLALWLAGALVVQTCLLQSLLSLLAESADDPALVRQAVPELKAQLGTALDDLRALARGIYPPLLAEQGLVMALRAQAARSPVPAEIEAGQVGRYPPDAESTVYFCALEALQNVAKHARASRVTVRLAASAEGLEFSVTEDGTGFPAAAHRHGSGLQGMSDRLAAHGGTLDISSQPGRGTTITGRLPVLPAGHVLVSR